MSKPGLVACTALQLLLVHTSNACQTAATLLLCSCRSNDHYQEVRQRIDALISQDFQAATEYAAVFEEHRKVYTFGQTWSFEAYSSKKK